MTRFTINSETTLQSFIGEMREMWKARKYLTVTVRGGKGRSLDQNAISHAWYAQVARELREDDERGVKRFCKLHYGVPILRAEDDDYRESYDAVIKPLDYETKIKAMDHWPVTSMMTTIQLHQYMLDVQEAYSGRVALEFPPDEKAA